MLKRDMVHKFVVHKFVYHSFYISIQIYYEKFVIEWLTTEKFG